MPNENTTPQLEHQIRRPEYQSPEFWITIIAGLIVAIGPSISDVIGETFKDSPATPVALALLAAVYAAGQKYLRASRNAASAAASMPSTVNAGGNISVNPEPQSETGTAVSEPEPENQNIEEVIEDAND